LGSSGQALRSKPTLSVEGGLAAHAGGGDRLSVFRVRDIARGEDALDVRVLVAMREGDVARIVELEPLPSRNCVAGVWPMAMNRPVTSSEDSSPVTVSFSSTPRSSRRR
jgi:hypothetical protein